MPLSFRSGRRIGIAVAGTLAVLLGVTWYWLTQPTLGSYPYEPTARAEASRLEDHVRFLSSDAAPRNPRYPDNLDLAADYIREHLERTGARVTEQAYRAGDTTQRNIVARFGPGSGPLVVVGAHYDVWSDLPGADDNASGVAGLLEVARILGVAEPPGPVELVAYSTEESPFFRSPEMGSVVHAESLRAAGVEVRAMISLEMIGYFSDWQPTPLQVLRLMYPSTGDFVLVAGRREDRPLIAEVKKAFRGASDLTVCSYCGPTRIGTDLSDQLSYWDRGYTAVMITDTAFVRNPNYHSPADTAETLDYTSMAGVVDGVANAVAILAGGARRAGG